MIYPNPLPVKLPDINKLLAIWNILKGIFSSPKNKQTDTPNDVSARNQAFIAVSKQIDREAKAVEEYVTSEIEKFSCDLHDFTEDSSHVLSRYHIRSSQLSRDINHLKQQIPGLIGHEVSRNLSESNPECDRALRMQPGVQKEVAFKTLISSIINKAVDKCAQSVQTVLNDMFEEYTSTINDAIEESVTELHKKAEQLQALEVPLEDKEQREAVILKSMLTVSCCDFLHEAISKEAM